MGEKDKGEIMKIDYKRLEEQIKKGLIKGADMIGDDKILLDQVEFENQANYPKVLATLIRTGKWFVRNEGGTLAVLLQERRKETLPVGADNRKRPN